MAESGNGQDIVSLTNDYLFPMRKGYGMVHQISVHVTDITRTLLTFDLRVGKPFNRREHFPEEKDQRRLVFDVRNQMLAQLGNLVPCPGFKAIYSDDTLDINGKEFRGPFHDVHYDTVQLGVRGQRVIAVEDIIRDHRETYRERFKKLWDSLDSF